MVAVSLWENQTVRLLSINAIIRRIRYFSTPWLGGAPLACGPQKWSIVIPRKLRSGTIGPEGGQFLPRGVPRKYYCTWKNA